jgi:hypothetical protein
MPRHQPAGQIHSISYLEHHLNMRQKADVWERQQQIEILNSDNGCFNSVHDPLSSCLLSKKVKFKIYRTMLLPTVCYGCEI